MKRANALRGLAGLTAATLVGCLGEEAPSVNAIIRPNSFRPAFGSEMYSSDDIDRAMALIAGVGGVLIRTDVMSSSPAYYDALFAAAAAHGIRPVIISPYATQPVDVASYAQQCAALHTQYRAANPIWELWNEPNLARYWGAEPAPVAYARLAVATASALFAVGATDVWSGGTSGVDLPWIYNLQTNGVLQAVSGCAVHSYKPPGFARTEYIQAQGMMPHGVLLHTTETCVASGKNDQSAFFREMWNLHVELSIPTMIWCELRDRTAGTRPPYTDAYGLVDANYNPKPVYTVAQTVIAAA
jgi:hypothetical protein